MEETIIETIKKTDLRRKLLGILGENKLWLILYSIYCVGLVLVGVMIFYMLAQLLMPIVDSIIKFSVDFINSLRVLFLI